MQLELNRATFRRLVQLYAASYLISTAVIAAELLLLGGWLEFSDDFDAIVARHFGTSSFDMSEYWTLGALLFILTWTFASIAGLYWFKPWARFGNWASAVIASVTLLAVDGYRPSYTSPAVDFLLLINGGLFGAIVLLSYAKGFGADWFGSTLTNVKE